MSKRLFASGTSPSFTHTGAEGDYASTSLGTIKYTICVLSVNGDTDQSIHANK